MQFTRRRFLGAAGAAGATGLLVACGGAAPAAPPAAQATQAQPTRPPAVAPVASISPPTAAPAAQANPAASPAAAPAASPAAAPVASPAARPAPSPSAAAQPAVVAAKQMYQQDAQHTGRSRYAGPRQGTTQRRFDMAAPENIPPDALIPRADVQSSSVIGPDGTIYLANFAGVLFALRDSAAARDQLEAAWRFHPPAASSFHATPALSADSSTLYLGFASGGFNAPGQATLYALKTAPGGPEPQVLWQVDLGATRVMSSPTVGPDGTVYVTTADGRLLSVTADGAVRWTAQAGPTIKAAPALATDGTVYVSSSDGHMYAMSAQGTLKWSFEFNAHLGPTPLVTSTTPGQGGNAGGANGVGSGASPTVGPDGTVYIGANNSNMYAVSPDGTMKWLFEAERELAGIWTTPVLSADGSVIYFGANKGGLYAVNTADGTRRWQFPIYGSVYASSTMDSQGTLYTGSTIEHLYAVNSSTGESVWDVDIRNPIWSAPSIRPDGTLVIADRSGLVQVIG